MRSRFLPLGLLAAALVAVPTVVTANPAGAAPVRGEQRVCAAPAAGFAACHAHVATLTGRDGKVRPDATTGPTGYSPAQLRKAYGLTGNASTTVAVVDAYAHPNALSDLNTYRAQFGLAPLVNGTTFRQFNQNGGTTMPSGNTGWGQEEMLDLEMVSAICPGCSIVYVAGTTASFADLGAAVNTAAGIPGVTVISNSYGAGEFNGETAYADAYNHPGIAITVSSGDSGYGVQVPAAFNTVTAVGGTTLTLNGDGTRASETVWSGAGSGCSAYIARQTWEPTAKCSRRTVADVAAVADPATGVSVYDTYGSTGGNWYVFGGTSVAAPIIGAVYALSGSTAGIPAKLSYDNRAALFDVKSGSNARGKCRSGYLCSATTGYDGPTGNGTPNGSLSPF